MKITGKNSLSNVIKIGLQIVFILGLGIMAFLPFLLKVYTAYINPFLKYLPTLMLLYASGVPALVIVNRFIHIFDTLKLSTPFIKKNVIDLKTISICSLIIAIEYVIGLIIIKSIFAMVVIGVFVIAWLGLYILSELLKQAIEYKEENDLTI